MWMPCLQYSTVEYCTVQAQYLPPDFGKKSEYLTSYNTVPDTVSYLVQCKLRTVVTGPMHDETSWSGLITESVLFCQNTKLFT